jgi:hypothetical protein
MRDGAAATLARRGLRSRLREAVGPALRRSATARAPQHVLGVLVRAVELALVGLGFALLPLWPFVAALIARDAGVLRPYPRALRACARHIAGMLRGRSIARYLLGVVRPGGRPRERIAGACTHCGNCCLYRSCVFLACDVHGQSRCRIYGGSLWRLLACGQYPIDGEEIELFACPSFVAWPPAQDARRVIPIASAGFSPSPPAGEPGRRTGSDSPPHSA